MRVSKYNVWPCSTITPPKHVTLTCRTIAQTSRSKANVLSQARVHSKTRTCQLSMRWFEYQGINDWEGLLDPLDDILRKEIIRYGHFVDATYRAFDFDTSSPSYATCRYERGRVLDPNTGYRVTRSLQATSCMQVPRWIANVQSSWIGYVAVCDDVEEIARLGRRDIVIAYRGTATCSEWLENLRATLTSISNTGPKTSTEEPMVECGFLSLYTSKTNHSTKSLQNLVREEIKRLIEFYVGEPISITITGHSLGAALATLTAYDIKTTYKNAPLVTVVSFGGPRVGNRSFRCNLEKCGVKVLRIVNSDDLITKVPGFVLEDNNNNNNYKSRSLRCTISRWIKKRVEDTRWVYADIGRELRVRSSDSPELAGINVAACHDLKTYLHLVNGFVSSTCPFRATARKMMKKKTKEFINS